MGDEHQHDLSRDELHTTAAQRLRSSGLRYTTSRRAVVELLAISERPLTIPEILAEDLTSHHHHLVCTRCGRVSDVVLSAELEHRLTASLDDVAGAQGFHAEHHRLDVLGRCADCIAV